MCCSCVDYLLTSLTIATSTHTNYFDHIFKERGAEAPLSRPIIQSRFSLSTPCRLLFFNPEPRFPQPQVAGYYNNLSQLVKYSFQLNTHFLCFRIMLTPKELRIIQSHCYPSSTSRRYFIC